MSILDLLSQEDCWEQFYTYKTGLALPKTFTASLREFIDRRGYEPICARIAAGERLPLPRKAVISKMSTGKKRTVYTYPEDENTVLKLLTFLLLRKYDSIFSRNLFSFRPGRTAKDAIRSLTHIRGISGMYTYKADISNYFNSIPVSKILPMLADIMPDDPALYRFLSGLLLEPQVLDRDNIITEEKGIMAGTPLSSFYANLYLMALDRHFQDLHVPYARYSDDIILFAETKESAEAHAQYLRQFLAERGLTLNPAKETFSAPGETWCFLGFQYQSGTVDIAPASVKKLKAKMRRKAHALSRWHKRRGMSGQKAAAAFIRIFNHKLLESSGDHELTWSHWFFPVITTAESLREIDRYAQECLRWLISGTRTKKRFRVRYADLKALGYQSLVHAYYDFSPADQNAE